MKKFIFILIALATVCAVCFASYSASKNKRAQEEFARAVEEYRLEKFQRYEAENQLYSAFEVDALFLGDSLTDMYELEKYYPSYLTLNRGIGGDTTVGLEERLALSVYDVQPKVCLMLIGANNMREMFENYENILIGLRDNLPKTKIVLLSLTSMGLEWGKNNQLAAYNNVKIKMLAEKYSFEYVDLYSALMNLETGEIYPEYTTDGGHLTPLGYDVLTAEITPVIEQLLAEWQAENEK